MRRAVLLASLAARGAAIGALPKGFKVLRDLPNHFKHWDDPKQWSEKHVGGVHAKGFPVTTTTYTSPVIKLMKGESAFTLNPVTGIPFPSGDYTILRADFQIVDESGSAQIPLSEVYNHHWLIGTTTSINPLDSCEDNLFFGAGAEMHGMPTVFQDGLGMMRIGAKGKCGGNLHFIRTEDLATNWTGANNPNGDIGAATKNCIECGWAPGRAAECINALTDGTYGCCLSGARCPVNHPEDKSTKSYHLQYEVQWTRNLTSTVLGGGGVLDLSSTHPDDFAEWNVYPHAKTLPNQVCDDTVCNATLQWTVEGQKGFGDGICPGELVWGYLHQHTGAIGGTLFVNGKKICASRPVIGTDPTNPVGNEKGYLVSFHPCIDRDDIWKVPEPSETLKKSVRINMGDVITVEGLYDVDPASTRNLPIPGGKHGGVMGLFFYSMICDPGTFYADYSCRQGACIPVSKGKGDFKDLATCQAALSSSKCAAPPPGEARYHCDTDAGQCIEAADGHSTMAKCQEACGAVPPTPPTPAPKYSCQGDVCVPGGPVDLKTCQAACG